MRAMSRRARWRLRRHLRARPRQAAAAGGHHHRRRRAVRGVQPARHLGAPAAFPRPRGPLPLRGAARWIRACTARGTSGTSTCRASPRGSATCSGSFGPYAPLEGHRFNPNRLLLDPYAKALTGSFTWNLADARGLRPRLASGRPVLRHGLRRRGHAQVHRGGRRLRLAGRPAAGPAPALQRDLRDPRARPHHAPQRPPAGGARTRAPSAAWWRRSRTCKDLGVTALELLPVQEFDELDNPRANPLTGERLQNYWGYSTMSFFAPKGRYSSSGALGEQVREFKEMVRELHQAGIEVILDIVFNHTAEGDETGPDPLLPRPGQLASTTCWSEDKRRYKNYTRLRQHPQLQPPDRAHPHPGLPAVLGRGHARGRLPLRPGLRPGPRREGQAAGEPPGAGAHRRGPGAARHQDHRRGLGRGRRLPGGLLPRRALGGVERPLPRRRARLLARRPGDGAAPGHPPHRLLRPVPARRPEALPLASTS